MSGSHYNRKSRTVCLIYSKISYLFWIKAEVSLYVYILLQNYIRPPPSSGNKPLFTARAPFLSLYVPLVDIFTLHSSLFVSSSFFFRSSFIFLVQFLTFPYEWHLMFRGGGGYIFNIYTPWTLSYHAIIRRLRRFHMFHIMQKIAGFSTLVRIS
jgi:hypothetical protein